MHPVGYDLAQAHLTSLRHQAQRAALARDARRGRPHQGGHPRPGFARRALAVLRPRNYSIAPAGRTNVPGGSDV